MKKILSFMLVCILTVFFTGVLVGCEDDVKVNQQDEVNKEQKEIEVCD